MDNKQDIEQYKIGFLCSSLSRMAGGILPATIGLANSLGSLSHMNIRFFGIEDSYTLQDIPETLNFGVSGFASTDPKSFSFAAGLAKALKDGGLDLLHVHSMWIYPSLASLSWVRYTGKPYIISPHGMLDRWALENSAWKKKIVGGLYENRHLSGASCLHALNIKEAEAIREYGLDSPICVIPNGIDLPEHVSRKTLINKFDSTFSSERIMIYIGRIHPKKGLSNLIKAWHIALGNGVMSGENWRLHIIGWDENNHQQELEELVDGLGIRKYVHFPGAKYSLEKNQALQNADAFVLPSFSEGLPMSVLEAWAYGLPSITTQYCNLPEGERAGATLIAEPTPHSFAEKLTTIWEMPFDQLVDMGIAGRELVEEKFTWEAIAQEMSQVYSWIIDGSDIPSSVMLK